MQQAIEIFVALNFLLIGISHIIHHRKWAEFIVLLRAQGYAGVFANGLLTLLTGTLIVSFHNVWTGPAVIITVVGWLYMLKSTVVFLFPSIGMRSMDRVTLDNSRIMIAPGVILSLVGVLSAWCAWIA